MRRPPAPLAPIATADLAAMLAADLPPCKVTVRWRLPFRKHTRLKRCGKRSVAVLTLHCPGCGTRRPPCCRWHATVIGHYAPSGRIRCLHCGELSETGGLS